MPLPGKWLRRMIVNASLFVFGVSNEMVTSTNAPVALIFGGFTAAGARMDR